MGIRLEWEIEADNTTIQTAGEDPHAARARRMARLRLLVAIGFFVGLIGCAAAFVFWRSYEVDTQMETLLRDTVTAEVTALRLGDLGAYSEIQRSASPDWIQNQRALFEEYQQLMLRSDEIQLTGRILDYRN